jgi:hypothetical protein
VTAALVTVHVESQPGGAVATLIDGGKASQVGTTPLDIELDSSRSYDVVVSLDGHTPHVEHITPTTNQDLMFALDEPARAAGHHTAPSAATAATGTLKQDLGEAPVRDRSRWSRHRQDDTAGDALAVRR